MTNLHAHYYVNAPGSTRGFTTPTEVYVKVYDITDDGQARVLAGDRIVGADVADPRGVFEFIALVRDEDLVANVQIQPHVTWSGHQ